MANVQARDPEKHGEATQSLQSIEVTTSRFIDHRARSVKEHRRRARHGEGPYPLNQELHGLLAYSHQRLRPDAEIVSGSHAHWRGVIANGEAKGFVPHRMHKSTESLLHEKDASMQRASKRVSAACDPLQAKAAQASTASDAVANGHVTKRTLCQGCSSEQLLNTHHIHVRYTIF